MDYRFELLKAAFHNSCSLPVWGAVVAGIAAALAASWFLELAIVVPGAMLGVVLAYQAQTFLTSVSPTLREAPIMTRYYWCVAILAALVFAFVAHKLREDIFILVTSALGAFGVTVAIRGLLLDYGHARMADHSELLVVLGTFILGLAYQHRSYKKE